MHPSFFDMPLHFQNFFLEESPQVSRICWCNQQAPGEKKLKTLSLAQVLDKVTKLAID